MWTVEALCMECMEAIRKEEDVGMEEDVGNKVDRKLLTKTLWK